MSGEAHDEKRGQDPADQSDSAMERRSAFVAEVAETIRTSHGKERESFVLGLSGKWGEGKSHFLGELAKQLKAMGFEVIDLNPWKYAADRVAFLRAFLVQLLETQSAWSRACAAARLARRGRWSDMWAMLRLRRSLVARLKTDVTRQRISISRLLLLLVPVVVIYWLYTHTFAAQMKPIVDQLRLPITLFLVPVSIWLIQGLVNSQASSKAATAIDEFDSMRIPRKSHTRSTPSRTPVPHQRERVGAKRRGCPGQRDGVCDFTSTSAGVSAALCASILPSARF